MSRNGWRLSENTWLGFVRPSDLFRLVARKSSFLEPLVWPTDRRLRRDIRKDSLVSRPIVMAPRPQVNASTSTGKRYLRTIEQLPPNSLNWLAAFMSIWRPQ